MYKKYVSCIGVTYPYPHFLEWGVSYLFVSPTFWAYDRKYNSILSYLFTYLLPDGYTGVTNYPITAALLGGARSLVSGGR